MQKLNHTEWQKIIIIKIKYKLKMAGKYQADHALASKSYFFSSASLEKN